MNKKYAMTIVKHGNVYNVPVHCERKKRKTLVLRVYPKTAKVLFSMPLRTPEDYADKFFEQHKPWLAKQLEKILPLQANHDYENGEVFYLYGRQIQLAIKSGERNLVYLADGRLVCEEKQPDKQKRKQRIEKFFERQFALFLQEHYAEIFARHNHQLGITELPLLKTRKMTSKWGICRPSKQEITLSKRLVHFEQELIEYVIVHELCHFVHLDHSPDFWRLMQKLMPDCKQRRQSLNASHRQIDI